MKKYYLCIALGAFLLALSVRADAQQPAKIPRIGLVSSSGDSKAPGLYVEAFRQGLRELGYIEGKNVLIEYRYVEGNVDRIPGLVAELVQIKVDVLVGTAPSAVRAAKQATTAIPIVMVVTQDPVKSGLVSSLAHPGGNLTGLTRLTRDLSGKRLELLKEAIPTISRVGVLSVMDPTPLGSALKEYKDAARVLKIPLQPLEVLRAPNPDIEGAFRSAVKGRVSALIKVSNNVLSPYHKKIADLAAKYRLPSMSEGRDYVEAGGLMSYAANDVEVYRRAATYVDKILKGAKPAELPVEQPTKFEFVINLKTAKQIGLTISQSVLFRADKVIK